MTIEYFARVESPSGGLLHTFANFTDPTDGGGAGLDYVLNVGQPSVLLLTLPAETNIDLVPIDGRILPMRSIHGRSPYNDNLSCYFIRKHTFTESWIRVTAYHATSLLARRAVLYDTGSSYAQKSATFAGNLIKAFARENIGSSISSANRDSSTTTNPDLVTPGYLVIEGDKNDGASIAKSTERGSLLGVIQDICTSSTQSGTYLSFGIIYSAGVFYLITKQNQWGTDRRSGSDQIVLSPQRGNMDNWRLDIDQSDEVTFASAGGIGQNDLRLIGTAYDVNRATISPFNLIERFYDGQNATTQNAVDAIANSKLREGIPLITFEADLVDGVGYTRGIDYDLGDMVIAKVLVQDQLKQYDCRLDTIYVSIGRGQQLTRVHLKSPV